MLLQSRITLIASVALIALGLGSIVAGLISRGAVEDRFEQALTAGKHNLIRQIVQTHANQMRSATASLTRNRDALAAIGENNAELVGEEIQPTFNRLSASDVLDRIRIIGKTGKVLFSEPAIDGNQPYNNPVLAEAEDTHEVRSGIVVDEDGVLTVAFAFPVYQRGSYVGAALYASSFAKVVDEFVTSDSGHAALANVDGQIVHTTDQAAFTDLDISSAAFSSEGVRTISSGENAFTVTAIPIVGANGEPAGQLVSVNDYTKNLSRQQRYDLSSIAVFIVLVMIVLISLNIYLRKAFAPLGNAIDCLDSISRGETDVDIVQTGRNDEVGLLIGSLERVRVNIEDFKELNEQKLLDQEMKVEEQNKRRAQERAIVDDVISLVDSVFAGDLSRRLDLTGKDGVFKNLTEQLNLLIDQIDAIVGDLNSSVGAMADGDLTKRMQGDHRGAFARLKQNVDRMAEQMEEVVGRIANVSSVVETATGEISAGISDLSLRTEHQASTLEETTASMEELSATVRQNADNAQEANQVAIAARESAAAGGAVAERAVSAMSGIEDSSKKITEIVVLIQEIAFQTNLLALNASVEAARAGEAGRGFAVVANEVRALAQRAAAASKDIKELITNSDDRIQEGVRLVGEAGGALEEIVSSVKKVADFVSEIASASQEQTSGIDQVSGAVTGMDEMTQQNASLVEETTASIQSAVSQVADLQQAVGFFRIAQLAPDEPLSPEVPRQQAAG